MGSKKKGMKIRPSDKRMMYNTMVTTGAAPSIGVASYMIERPSEIECYICVDEADGAVHDFITIRNGDGDEHRIDTRQIVRVEDYYIWWEWINRRRKMTTNREVFMLVNAKLDKQRRLVPKKDTEKLRHDMEQWDYMVRHNCKCKLFGSGTARLQMFDYRLKAIVRPSEKADTVVIPKGASEIKSSFYSYDAKRYTGMLILSDELRNLNNLSTSNIIPKGTFRIPEGVKRIDGYAMYGNYDIEGVEFPKSLKALYGKAFMDCRNLRSVKFSGPLFYLGPSVFTGCSKLKEITLPNGIKTVHMSAFDGCAELEKIVVPKSVKEIIGFPRRRGSAYYSSGSPQSVLKIYVHESTVDKQALAFNGKCPDDVKIIIYDENGEKANIR